MIMYIIDIYFFRGSPIPPAGPSLNKSSHVRVAAARCIVHLKMLAKKENKSQVSKFCQDQIKTTLFRHSTKFSPALTSCSVSALSSYSTNTATAAVAGESPWCNAPPNPDPLLQVWVGHRRSWLYAIRLGGTPLTPDSCQNIDCFNLVLMPHSLILDISSDTGLLSWYVLSRSLLWPMPGSRYVRRAAGGPARPGVSSYLLLPHQHTDLYRHCLTKGGCSTTLSNWEWRARRPSDFAPETIFSLPITFKCSHDTCSYSLANARCDGYGCCDNTDLIYLLISSRLITHLVIIMMPSICGFTTNISL